MEPNDPARMPGAAATDWKTIRKDVLQRIQAGIWKPGTTIPREIDIAQDYGCTRSTVGRALRDLAAAGFLDRRRKGGTRVAANPVRKAPLDVPIMSDAIRATGATPGYRLIAAEIGTPPPHVTSALGLPAGIGMLHVRGVHLADDKPHQYESRWLHRAAVPGLDAAVCTAGPVDEWLLHNTPLTRASIEISAVAAPNCVAEALDLAPGTATLLVTRISWRQAQPISHLRLYHSPGFCLHTAI